MSNKTTTLQNIPKTFKIKSLNIDSNIIYSVQAHEIIHGKQQASPTTVLLPASSIITDTEIYQHCPELKIGLIIQAIKNRGGLHQMISPAITVQKKSVGCDGVKIEIQSSVGEVGPKGQKGDTGFGGDGEKGEPGESGTGTKGEPGENIDWNNASQNSISIGGVTFGPRLIGVCKNGEYKYTFTYSLLTQ